MCTNAITVCMETHTEVICALLVYSAIYPSGSNQILEESVVAVESVPAHHDSISLLNEQTITPVIT